MPSRAVFERLAHMGNHSVSLGGATVTRVVELQLELPRALFPDTPAAAWHDNADLLALSSGVPTPTRGGSLYRPG